MIDVQPGNVIVAKCQKDTVNWLEARELYELLKKTFPDNKVVVVPCDFVLSGLPPEKFWGFLESMKNLRPQGEREEHNQ